MTQSYILALDIGTSSTRAILYDANGVAEHDVRAQMTYTLTTSQEGEASVEADFLLDLVAKTIDEVLLKAGERAKQIVGVATSTFWHTLLPLDASGHPLMPLMTWEDTRPQQAAIKLRTMLDETAIHKRTGVRLHTSYWPAKIYWLTSTQPEIAQKAVHYVSFGEYMHARLLGHSLCSLSMASGTGLLNLHTFTWDSELLQLLHLTPDTFSSIEDFSHPTRGLSSEFATRWPALNEVPWFPAVGDGAAANIGSRCANSSTWAITMGTSSAIRVVVPAEQAITESGLWLYFVNKQRALLGGALSEGGNMYAWLRQTLQLPEPEKMEEQLEQLKPASHGLTILPLLAGERSPGWHINAHMTISGLSLHSTPIEIVQAALESIVFQLSHIYDQLRHTLSSQVTQPRLIVSGATLLKSSALRQILADTLNSPLELSGSTEASACGVALLALETLGLMPDLAQLAPEVPQVVQPDPARHAIYSAARARQQDLYHRMLEMNP